MTTDLEVQLGLLGRYLDDAVAPVSVAEIHDRASTQPERGDGIDVVDLPTRHGGGRRRTRLLAVAAVVVVAVAAAWTATQWGNDGQLRRIDEPSHQSDPTSTVPVDASPSVGRFVPTGNMQTDCFGCAALTLADGSVIVAGGVDRGVSVVQRYDPDTRKFSVVGRVDGYVGRAAVLGDGRIVLAGSNGELAIFDPATGAATTLRVDNDERQVPPGLDYTVQIPVALADGRVLVFSQAGASEVDLATGSLTDVGMMTTPLSDTMGAVPLLDGTVLVFGAPLTTGGPVVFQVYDTVVGEFGPTGVSERPMTSVSAVRLLDGRVLAIGNAPYHAEIYDPAARSFSTVEDAPPSTGQSASPVAVLPDGRVLVLVNGTDITAVAGTSLFDPVSETFVTGPSTLRPRFGASAATLQDGSVLLLGSYRGNAQGIPGDGPASAEILVFDGQRTSSEGDER